MNIDSKVHVLDATGVPHVLDIGDAVRLVGCPDWTMTVTGIYPAGDCRQGMAIVNWFNKDGRMETRELPISALRLHASYARPPYRVAGIRALELWMRVFDVEGDETFERAANEVRMLHARLVEVVGQK